MSIMVRFIFWCLKRLAILTIKYTKHPEGVFEMGDNVVVKGKRYHYKFGGMCFRKQVQDEVDSKKTIKISS